MSASENLSSSSFDEDTIWLEDDMLPQDFDSTGHRDLSALQDEDDSMVSDY